MSYGKMDAVVYSILERDLYPILLSLQKGRDTYVTLSDVISVLVGEPIGGSQFIRRLNPNPE